MNNEPRENNSESEISNENKCCCCRCCSCCSKLPTCADLYIYFCLFLNIIISIEISAYYYFAFYGIASLTIYLFFYQWLTLFKRDNSQLASFILLNFLDLGLIFVLVLICVFVIKDYFTNLGNGFKASLSFTKNYLIGKTQEKCLCKLHNGFCAKMIFIFILFIYVIIIGLIIFLLGLGLWNKKARFIISSIIECFFLFSFFVMSILINIIRKRIKAYANQLKNENQNIPNNSQINESLLDLNREDLSQSSTQSNATVITLDLNTVLENNHDLISNIINFGRKALEIFTISTLDGMYEEEFKFIPRIYGCDELCECECECECKCKCDFDCKKECQQLKESCFDLYRYFIILFIIGIQIIKIAMPLLDGIYLSFGQTIIYILVRIIYFYKVSAYNIFYTIFSPIRTFTSLKEKKIKIVYGILLGAYVIAFIAFLVIHFKSKSTVFPSAKSATFIETNKQWYKMNGMHFVTPEGFCLNHATLDDSLQTTDLAMLTTLPRLYKLTKDGKCYIKPSMRGLFNTTMKYIFGKNYENDGIRILCKNLTYNPVLVITSDKILERTLEYFSKDSNITLFPKQFDIKNTNFFENVSFDNLTQEGFELLNQYKSCVKKNSTKNCEDKWDSFTQYYWPTMHSDELENITGFERYQITIESNTTIQPSFATGEGKLWAGTHYIVGGSYEDEWGVGFYIETFGRQYIPSIFSNLLILYESIRKFAQETFLQMEKLNSKMFYISVFSSRETNSLLKLYSQFNFSHHSLYTIGHSITGTSFKAASFYSDIRGIAFEAMDSEKNLNFLSDSSLKSHKNPVGQITNVFSKSSIFTGYDKSCDINALLPNRYKFPNVYDTACLTAISCSNTEKYVPFCLQTLAQKVEKSIEEFNKSYNAYKNYYGYD